MFRNRNLGEAIWLEELFYVVCFSQSLQLRIFRDLMNDGDTLYATNYLLYSWKSLVRL